MMRKRHPSGLEVLILGDLRRSVVRLRFGEQQVVSYGVAGRRAFVQQVEITLLRTGEIHAKLPAVLENLLSGRFELTLERFSVAPLLHGQRIYQRRLAGAGEPAAFPNQTTPRQD